jgi:hypothetical protein
MPFDGQSALEKHPQGAIVLYYKNPHFLLLEILLAWEELNAGDLLRIALAFCSSFLRASFAGCALPT